MSPPGIYVRGATTALTRRTTMHKAVLAPWSPLVEQFGLWFLAKAQMRSGVAVHSSHFVVNHHHTNITPSDADGIPLFTRIFHGELSCALSTLLLHEKYDAPGEIFARKFGDHSHAYPYGTYEARVLHGAPMADEPPVDAVVTRPGATLEEVKAELAERGKSEVNAEAERTKDRNHVLDQVREAFTEEAEQVVAHDDLELARLPQTAEPNPDPESEGAPHGVEVRRLSDPRARGRTTPSRITFLRDRRRGRPRRESPTHGSDPPA